GERPQHRPGGRDVAGQERIEPRQSDLVHDARLEVRVRQPAEGDGELDGPEAELHAHTGPIVAPGGRLARWICQVGDCAPTFRLRPRGRPRRFAPAWAALRRRRRRRCGFALALAPRPPKRPESPFRISLPTTPPITPPTLFSPRTP